MIDKINTICVHIEEGFKSHRFGIRAKTDVDVSRLTVTFYIHNLTHKKYITIPFRFDEINSKDEKEIIVKILCETLFFMLAYEKQIGGENNDSNA